MEPNEAILIGLGMFVNELEHLQTKHGIWLQGAEVYTLNQADPIATIGAGGGGYAIQMIRNKVTDQTVTTDKIVDRSTTATRISDGAISRQS